MKIWRHDKDALSACGKTGEEIHVATSRPLTKGLPMVEHERVQLGRGPEEPVVRQARSKAIYINKFYFGPDYTSHGVVDPRWIAFAVHLKWEGDFIFNGRELSPNELMMSSGPNGWVTRGRERHVNVIAMRRDRLEQAYVALAGEPIDFGHFDGSHLSLTTPHGLVLNESFADVLSAYSVPDGFGTLPQSVENDLLTQCALFFLHQTGGDQSKKLASQNAVSLVRKAKWEIEKRHPEAMSLAELCAATGVGKAWLHKSFMEVHGYSPIAYLRARRLSIARQWLLDTTNPPRSVKDVSIALGFTNGGRFAASYAELFGEMPAETFVRSSSANALHR